MNNTLKLKDLLLFGPVGSPGSIYTIVYANGRRNVKTVDAITEKEFNTMVANIFATDYGRFQVHLHKLGRDYHES